MNKEVISIKKNDLTLNQRSRIRIISEDIIQIDLHSLGAEEAEKFIESILHELHHQVKNIILIHGYKHGNRIKDKIRAKQIFKFNYLIRPYPKNKGRTKLIKRS